MGGMCGGGWGTGWLMDVAVIIMPGGPREGAMATDAWAGDSPGGARPGGGGNPAICPGGAGCMDVAETNIIV